MISRVAESCFWLTRYIERAETVSRVLDVTETLLVDGSFSDIDQWRPIVIVCGEEESFLERHSAEAMSDGETVLSYLTWDTENPTSVYSSIRWARENVRTIREAASLEMWETINDLWLWIRTRAAKREYSDDRHGFYVRLKERCMLFDGVRHATMLHETPYDFMQLGAYLERVSQTARILDVKYHSIGPDDSRPSPLETAQWLAALRSCSGAEPFFKRAVNELDAVGVTEFLLFDQAFPRSVRHNLDRAAMRLDAVRTPDTPEIGATSAAMLQEMQLRFNQMTVERVIEEGVHQVVTWIVDTTTGVCSAFGEDFFRWEPRDAPSGAVA